MKVLFYTYPWAMQNPGGGEIMLFKTKEALENKGITVKLFNQWEDRLKDYDILHIFGGVKDCLGLMCAAKNTKIKIVVSSLFWSTLQRSLHEYGNLYTKFQAALKHMTKVVSPKMPSSRRKMLTLADIVLPNSEAEANQVSRLFSINKNRMHVVPLGADERFTDANKYEFMNKYAIKDFILSVGRIEPRKNQLNLIKALNNSQQKLVIIGDCVSGYEQYYQQCQKAADKNVLFLNRLDHNSSLLSSAYAACSVFILQGWFETPGLVALEAGLAGAKLAVTNQGSTYEYFKDYVQYFNPASPKDIKNAIYRALTIQKDDKLKNHIRNNFLWANSADATIAAYQKIFN